MKLVNLRPEHLEELVKIVNNTWNYEEEGITPDENIHFSTLDLYDCLSRSNFAKVAIEDNKPVALLVGRDFTKLKDKKWEYLKDEAKKIEGNLKGRKNYSLLKDYEELYEEVNKSLKTEIGKDFDSELILFAVDGKYKGKGIGKALLTNFEDYLLENHLHSLYVFTDTNCDYRFYGNNGFKKLGALTRNPKLRNYVDVEFYIYSKSF